MRFIRRSLKPLAPCVLFTSTSMLVGTPAFAEAVRVDRARAAERADVATRLGVDPAWLEGPEAFRGEREAAQRAEAEAKINAIKAASPRPATSESEALIEEVRHRAALERLEGVEREVVELAHDDGGTHEARLRNTRASLESILPRLDDALGARTERARARSVDDGERAANEQGEILERARALKRSLDRALPARGGVVESALERASGGLSPRPARREGPGRRPLQSAPVEVRPGAALPPEARENGLRHDGLKGPRLVPAETPAPAKSREEYRKRAFLQTPELEEHGSGVRGAVLRWALRAAGELGLEGLFLPDDPAEYLAPLPLRLAAAPSFDLGLLAQSATAHQLAPPIAADTQPTVDAAFAPDVVALAEEIGPDPLALYRFVHDEIAYEVYNGSAKGALGTLLERRGNDFDQASLLIALLRANGIPARYQVGNVELEPELAQQVTGTTTGQAAANLLTSVGQPATTIYFAGGGMRVGVEHVWVKAYVPYGDYRGAGAARGERAWIDLDPSFTAADVDPGVDLVDDVQFDYSAYINSGTRDLPVDVWRDRVRTHIQTSGLVCPTLEDARYQSANRPFAGDKLPATLGYKVAARLDNYATIPAGKRHSVTLAIPDAYYDVDVQAQVSLPQIYGKRLSLRWQGATAQDQTRIDQGIFSGSVSGLRVVPAFWLDDQQLAAGSSRQVGQDFVLDVTLFMPGYGTETVDHTEFVSGGYHVVSLQMGRFPDALLDRAESSVDALKQAGAPAWKVDEAELWVTGLRYHRQAIEAATDIFGINGLTWFMDPLEALFTRVVNTTNNFGIVTGVSPGGYNVDAAKNTITPYGRGGNHALQVKYTELWGWNTSALEHRVWEQRRGADGVSAVKALQIAKAAGQPITTVNDPLDWLAVKNQLQLDSAVKSRIESFVNAGYKATFHRSNVTLRGWNGAGYILFHPQTGSGAYLINGTNGGDWPDFGVNFNPVAGEGEPCIGFKDPLLGSQVSPSSGSFRFSHDELTTITVAGTLTVKRTYHSDQEGDSAFSPGWTFTFFDRLDASQAQDGLLRVFGDDGKAHSYRLLPDGSYQGTRGVFDFVFPQQGGGHALFKQNGERLDFDADGKLWRKQTRRGTFLTFERNADGDPTAILDADGSLVLAFAYDGAGQPVAMTDAADRAVTYAYDAAGRLTSVTGLEGATWTYDYDDAGRLTAKTSPEDETWTYFYDQYDRAIRCELPDGTSRSMDYDELNRRAVYTDASGNHQVYEWDEEGVTVRVIDGLGNAQSQSYDEGYCEQSVSGAMGNAQGQSVSPDSGQITSQQLPDGSVVQFVRDAQGRLVGQLDGEGNETAIGYDAQGNLASIDGPGGSLAFEFDGYGRPVEVAEVGGPPSLLAYDAHGNPSQVTTPEGDTVTLHYDDVGRLVGIEGDSPEELVEVETDERGLVTRLSSASGEVDFGYDGLGRRTSMTAPGRGTQEYAYDHDGRLTSVMLADATSRSVRYDGEGRLAELVDGFGESIRYEYDALGALTRVVDREGAEIQNVYCADEAAGAASFAGTGLGAGTDKVCISVDATGSLRQQTFDDLGRVAEVTASDGSTLSFTYDPVGRAASYTDELGRTTEMEYDDAGRLLRVVDALSGQTTFAYDARGRRTSMTDPAGRTTQYTYDEEGRPLTILYPDGVTHQRVYNAYGLVVGEGPPGQLTEKGFAADLRLEEITFPDGTAWDYQYDGSLLDRVVTDDGTFTYLYDEAGRRTGYVDEELQKGVEIAYDPNGRIAQVIDGEGAVTSYRYNKNDWPVEIVRPDGQRFRMTYDDAGRIVERSLPNGTRQHFLYNGRGFPLSTVVLNAAGSVVSGYSYAYDARGNRTQVVDHVGRTTTFTYDALDRLLRAQGPGRDEQYTYDAAGNRLTSTVNGTTRTFTYNAGGRLTQIVSSTGVESFTYDAAGRIATRTTTGGTTSYAYTGRGQLRQVTLPGGKVIEYGYSPEGNRVLRREDGVTVRTLYHGVDPIADYDEAGNVVAEYVFGPGDSLLFAANTNGQWIYAHTDVVQSVTHLTDASGAVVLAFDYSPFGAAQRTAGTGGLPPMFTGRPLDEDTGLYDMRMRAYDPFQGRFYGKDPVPGDEGRPQTLNPYAYGLNNPLVYVDRSGRCAVIDPIEKSLECLQDPVKCAQDKLDEVKEELKEKAKDTIEKWLGNYLLAAKIVLIFTISIAFVLSLTFYKHYTRFFFIAAAALEDSQFLKDWALYTFNFARFFIQAFNFALNPLDALFEGKTFETVDEITFNIDLDCLKGWLFCWLIKAISDFIINKLKDAVGDNEPWGCLLVELVARLRTTAANYFAGCGRYEDTDPLGL